MSSTPQPPLLFDRRLVRARRARAAAAFSHHAFLFERAAGDLADRLNGLDRRFDLALDLAARGGVFRRALEAQPGAAAKIGRLVEADCVLGQGELVADDEALPFAPRSADLLVSALSLHAANDLPGALIQIARILTSGGLFLSALFGGETLRELRRAFADAEIESDGGLSPRVSPFVDIRDAAALLQRAGFARPVSDREEVTVTYATPLHLLQDLRGMGETNVLRDRKRTPLRRATLARALELYADRHSMRDGRVSATFELIYLTGFAP